jgi:hypothetical protein
VLRNGWVLPSAICSACATGMIGNRVEPAQMLQEWNTRYAAFSSYQEKGSEDLQGKARIPAGQAQLVMSTNVRTEFAVWYVAPNRFRFEWRQTSGKASGPSVLVSDGTKVTLCSDADCRCEVFANLQLGLIRAIEKGPRAAGTIGSLLGLAGSEDRFAKIEDKQASEGPQGGQLRGRVPQSGAPVKVSFDERGLVTGVEQGPPEHEFDASAFEEKLKGKFPDPMQRGMLIALMEMAANAASVETHGDMKTNEAIPDEVFHVEAIDTAACQARKKK